MTSEWIYYLFCLLLIAANTCAWAGTWYRLPGTWVMLGNVALFREFFPVKPSGLKIGYAPLLLLAALSLFGESLAFVARQRRRLAVREQTVSLNGTFAGAGVGGGLGALLGMTVPLLGPLVAVLGAVAGASAGASLGTVLSARLFEPLPSLTEVESIQQAQWNRWLETVTRVVTGFLIWLASISIVM